MTKPLIALTLGDPAGVGPEIIAAAWSSAALHQQCQLLVTGRPAVLRRAVERVDCPARVVEISSADQAWSSSEVIPCLECGVEAADHVPAGKVDAAGGQAAYDALVAAVQLAQAGEVNAICTTPLNKAALFAAGHRYPGHTELLADLCGVRQFAMMLYLANNDRVLGPAGLGVAHVTLHTALRNVFDLLTPEEVLGKCRLADSLMSAMLQNQQLSRPPRIGVCALNPHGGEQGLFGDEESRIIQPAVQQGIELGMHLQGPLPCDTLMKRAAEGEFDAVVAMYHDQGHIALKLLGMRHAVNITLGLPIIRTSVAHGTAYDLAWQAKASPTSLLEAVRVASQLAVQRPIQWNAS